MQTSDVLIDAYTRIQELVHMAAEGTGAKALAYRVEPDANSIAWLVWHLTRIQDHHVSELAGRTQAYVVEGWADRLLMAADENETGHGHTSAQVASIQPAGPTDLLGYHDSVFNHTKQYLSGGLTPDELDRIIDRRWDPPVSVGVRLVSVLSDNLQHAGQARYVRGIVDRLAIS